MAKKEWDGRTDGSNRMMELLYRLLRHVDIRVVYCVLPFVVCYYLVFARKRAGAIYSYLRKRQGWSVFRSAIGTYRNHIVFGKNLLDRFAVFAGRKDKFHISESSRARVMKWFNDSGAVVAVSAHIGNFEISAYICGWLDKPLKVVAFGGETEQMQKHRNASMGENNIGMITVKDDMSHIFEITDQLSGGGSVILTGDRFISGRRLSKCLFLGEEAYFPNGIYRMADKFGAKVVAMFVMRGARTFEYEVLLEPIVIDDAIRGREARAAAYAAAYAGVLERVVRKYPLQWFNFYDFWKKDD